MGYFLKVDALMIETTKISTMLNEKFKKQIKSFIIFGDKEIKFNLKNMCSIIILKNTSLILFSALKSLYLVVFAFHILGTIPSYSQNPHSDNFITYDLETQKPDKPIPFNRPFTLNIPKILREKVQNIRLFEIVYTKGERDYKYYTFTECESNISVTKPIKDIDLTFNPNINNLQIYFPPLKPEVHFDVYIISTLPEKNMNLLLDVNTLLLQGNLTSESKYTEFIRSTLDKLSNTICVSYDYSYYSEFFHDSIRSEYISISESDFIKNHINFTKEEIQSIDVATSNYIGDFKDAYYFLEIYNKSRFAEIQSGLINVNDINNSQISLENLFNVHKRVKNLEISKIYFDSIYNRLNRVISQSHSEITINRNTQSLEKLRLKLVDLRFNIDNNLNKLNLILKKVKAKIDKNENLRYGEYLTGNTMSQDLKTKGGRMLFADVGISTISIQNQFGDMKIFPKFHTGFSFYFKQIDKNTDSKYFINQGNINLGCFNGNYGPTYGIVSKKSIWQKLSLNVALTYGGYKDTSFENLISNTSLLIGPAYKIAGPLKISSGISLLRRSSNNPLISENIFATGVYASLSFDLDFIGAIKEVTSILLK